MLTLNSLTLKWNGSEFLSYRKTICERISDENQACTCCSYSVRSESCDYCALCVKPIPRCVAKVDGARGTCASLSVQSLVVVCVSLEELTFFDSNSWHLWPVILYAKSSQRSAPQPSVGFKSTFVCNESLQHQRAPERCINPKEQKSGWCTDKRNFSGAYCYVPFDQY